MLYSLLIIYALWNIVIFLLMGVDKYKAQHDKWRISETTLLITAFAMGGVGSVMGGQIFRHKTRKRKFKILLPAALCCNLAVLSYILLHIG